MAYFLNKLKIRYILIVFCIIGIGFLAFLLLIPYIYSLPIFNNNPSNNKLKYSISNTSLAKQIQPSLTLSDDTKLPLENKLVIPKIGVDSNIIEGENLNVLNKDEGVWREPKSGSPVDGGNMVIAGHRFQYLPPNTHTFYNLNKLEKDDLIIVYWKDTTGKTKDYLYKIYETKIVEPTDVSIRNIEGGLKNQITLYTCGPEVGQNAKRIVVLAVLL